MRAPFHRSFMAALALLLAFVLVGPLSAAAKPWYAARLEALGFQVFSSPQRLQDFSVTGLDGSKTSLSSLKGKVVLVNFWATWCPPCRAEMPSIQKLWKATKDQAFGIMAVSVGESAATVKDFVAKNGFDYPFFLDPTGRIGNLYGVQGIPTTYVFDKDGLAIARVVGGIEYASPEALAIFAELAKRPASGS
jgi:thiol-disulfide isomerase/thioredoxin